MDKFNHIEFSIARGKSLPFDGGVVTIVEKPLIPFGLYSELNNVKKWHPGISKRKGITEFNTTSISTDNIISLYQFQKDETDERHFFIQAESAAGASKLYDSATDPPTATTTLGTVVFTDSDYDVVPASFSDIRDVLLYSDGSTQHQLFPGDAHFCDSIFFYLGTVAPQRMIEDGNDVTEYIGQESDRTATFVISDADNAIYIRTDVPANQFTFDFVTPTTVSGGAVLALQQYVRDMTVDTSVTGFRTVTIDTDGTDDGDPWGQDGTIEFTPDDDAFPTYLFGETGYWYKFNFSSGTCTVEIISIKYNGVFTPLQNVASGFGHDFTEIFKEIDADATEYVYPSSTVKVGGMIGNVAGIGTADVLYFSLPEKIYAIYAETGSNPNTNAAAGATVVLYWADGAWRTGKNLEDETDQFTKSGFISWDYLFDNPEPTKTRLKGVFNTYFYALYHTTATLSDNVVLGFLGYPYYNIDDIGSRGLVSAAWKERGCWTFDSFPRDIHVSEKARPNVLNGSDYAIISPGDGRRNRITCMKSFHNELMVWQEEQASEGGCLTIFEGYSPSTYGKLVLSVKIGTFSAKSAVVVDGALSATRRDDVTQVLAFFISHYGIFVSDGRGVQLISQDIQNYFDTDFAECIRDGFEEQMWIAHDEDRGSIICGLVSGASATSANVFPVYDLGDKTWSFDTYPYNMSHFTEVRAATGQFSSLQYIAGAANGHVYKANDTLGDDGVGIAFKVRIEITYGGFLVDLREANIRMKVQPDGDLVKKIYENDRLISAETEDLSMEAFDTNDGLRRHRVLQRAYEETHISIEFSNSVLDEDAYLYDINYDVGAVLNK